MNETTFRTFLLFLKSVSTERGSQIPFKNDSIFFTKQSHFLCPLEDPQLCPVESILTLSTVFTVGPSEVSCYRKDKGLLNVQKTWTSPHRSLERRIATYRTSRHKQPS